MTDNDALVAFLRDQLDADERVARKAIDHSYGQHMATGPYGSDSGASAEHIALHDPARVLREVEAKRRLLDHIAGEFGGRLQIHDGDQWVDHGEIMLRLLATPYADQPGYRNEWRPA